MPVDAVGIKEMDFRKRSLGNEVQEKGTRPAQTDNSDPIVADMVLHWRYSRPCFEGIGYDGTGRAMHVKQPQSGPSAATAPTTCAWRTGGASRGRSHPVPDDLEHPLLMEMFDQVFPSPPTMIPDAAAIRMVHEPVLFSIGGDPDGMDVTAHPAIRFASGGVVGRLDGTGAKEPTQNEAGYLGRPNHTGVRLRVFLYLEADLFGECG